MADIAKRRIRKSYICYKEEDVVDRREWTLTIKEKTEISKLIEIVDIKLKGKGVRAKRDIKKNEFVGIMPGFIYNAKEHEKLVKKGLLTDKYAIDVVDIRGKVWVINPQKIATVNQICEQFYGSFGHMMNEPNERQRHIPVSYVHNYNFGDIPRIELYTNRNIPAGRELTIHYGDKYDRKKNGYVQCNIKKPKSYNIIINDIGIGDWENPEISWDGSLMSTDSDSD